MSVPANAATGFARAAGAYERTRPSYPPDAVAWLCQQAGVRAGKRVCDLAAGTGKLTRLLAPTGAELVAVEPVAEMRAELARALPDVEVRAGTAEALPLGDASVDAVLVGQAFHWFDAPAALDEIARVLRDGGGLGVIFNAWELDDPLQARLDELVQLHAPPDPDEPGVRPIPYTTRADASARWREAFPHRAFEQPAELELTWSQRLPAGDLAARIGSVSVIAALDEQPRAAALRDAAAIAAESGPEVALVYRTVAHAWRRRAR